MPDLFYTVKAKFYELIVLQGQYDSQVKAKSRVQSTDVTEDKAAESFKGKSCVFKDAIADYDSIVVMVEELFTNEDNHLTAQVHKDLLTKAFDKIDKLGQELLDMSVNILPAASNENRELYSCTKQRLTYRPMLVKLIKIINEHEIEARGVMSTTTPTDPLGGTSSSVGAEQCLKLKKLEARHFSGQRREYAAWKKEISKMWWMYLADLRLK